MLLFFLDSAVATPRVRQAAFSCLAVSVTGMHGFLSGANTWVCLCGTKKIASLLRSVDYEKITFSSRTKAFSRGEGGAAPEQYSYLNCYVLQQNKRQINRKFCGAVTEEGKRSAS
ncbi:MAG: hypothetical protein II629_00720 [Ruminococcus sp.]|nr:hypothetical protein [Ruminococcus sp.]